MDKRDWTNDEFYSFALTLLNLYPKDHPAHEAGLCLFELSMRYQELSKKYLKILQDRDAFEAGCG